jgi:hypothetical protein
VPNPEAVLGVFRTGSDGAVRILFCRRSSVPSDCLGVAGDKAGMLLFEDEEEA